MTGLRTATGTVLGTWKGTGTRLGTETLTMSGTGIVTVRGR